MYKFFGIQREPLHPEHDFAQTPSGLLLVDATNKTIRDAFFQKWSDCANEPECISPHGVYTVMFGKKPSKFEGSEY